MAPRIPPYCEICGVSVARGAALYRVSPKGIPASRWRCIEHMDKLPDPGLREIVEILSANPPDVMAPTGWRWNPRNGHLERIN